MLLLSQLRVNLQTNGALMSRYDVIAQVSHARRLAEKLYPLARMVELHGGHLVSHERTKEVYIMFSLLSDKLQVSF